MEKKIAAYKNLLVPKETGVVINTISRMARDSNVNIVSIKPAVPQKFPNYVKIPFTLVLSAPSFYDLGNFVSRLESFQDVYTIESMNTKRQGLASELQADLTINSISYQ